MQVRALESFFDECGRHSAGDVWEMADGAAVQRIKARLVVRVVAEPEMATARGPEMSILRKGKRY